MARKHFAFDNSGGNTPNRKHRKGKVSFRNKNEAISNPVYVPAVDSTGKFIIVSDSNSWRGRSTASATPIFFSSNGSSASDLIDLVNELREEKFLNPISTLSDAISYCESRNFIILNEGEVYPAPITDGLKMCIDAKFPSSYGGSGTTWGDISGNGYNASLQGATIASGECTFVGQGERDGSPTGDYVALNTTGTTTSPSVNPNGTTYDWWVKLTDQQPYGQTMLFGSGTINHMEFKNEGASNRGYFRTEAVTQNGYSFGSGNISGGTPLDTWMHFAVVFDESNATRNVYWYKDGSLFHTGNMSSGNNPTGEYFQPNAIGRATGTSAFMYSNSLKGKVSRFATYERALSASEIELLYEGNKVRHGH